MISADEALQRLREGNQRFVAERYSHATLSSEARRREVASGQEPFAIILGCSDSRVPAEIVFDQGIGDLFVIRVAGNVVAPSQIGSIEFAAERFGTRLVVVLGHSKCGAILATLEELGRPFDTRSRNLRSIVDRVRPVRRAADGHPAQERSRGARHRSRAGQHPRSVNQLRHGSDIIEDLTQSNGLTIVGAEYCLENGTVDFLDGTSAAAR